MTPILASSYPYTGNGLGGLPDALDCIVTHEVNGIYELSMRYPISGQNYGEIQNGYIIMAAPDNLTTPQPFRIYRITKPLNGIVTIYAQHIAYDMAGTIVEPFTASSLTEALTVIPTKCTPSTPFTINSTKTVASSITLSEPRPLWKLIGGQRGSLLDVYGGEWDFDRLTATLKTRIGTDRGVSIRYGKNMTDLEQDASLESTYSAVYPYWYDEETNTLVTLAQKTVAITGAAVTDRVLLLDCSSYFDDQPTEAQLQARAESYITANSVGNMKTSWKVSFVQLSQSPEYADQAVLEQVGLGDTLSVHYETLGVDASARVVKTEYNAIEEHYKSVTIGRVKQNLAQILVEQNEALDEKIEETKSDLERAVDAATDSIKHGGGQFRLIYNGDYLQEIVSLDNSDISLAQSVWRWNNGGFGHSSTGYNGSYTLALLPNGSINADMITVGTLSANRVRTGLITDQQGNNSWNLDTGLFSITNGKFVATHNRTFYYSSYSSSDLNTIVSLVNAGSWTDADLLKYDFNLDGRITLADRTILNNMLTNNQNRTVSIKTEIDPSKTDKPICIYDGNGNPATYLSPNAVVSPSGSFSRLSATAIRGGNLDLKDAGGEARLTSGGLEFFNSSGTLTMFYPTSGDIVIEYGTTTSGWTYRKWRSGVYECWIRQTYRTTISTKWGSNGIYYTEVTGPTYPVSFNDVPFEQATAHGGDGWFWLGGTGRPQQGRAGDYILLRPTQVTSAANFYVDFYVRGTV